MKITTLSLEEVISNINAIKPGTYTSITYYTLPKTTDKSTIVKVTRSVVRTKIDRTRTKSYEVPLTTRKDNSEYIINNALKRYPEKNTTNFCIFPNWRQTRSTYFDENGEEIEASVAKARIKQPSSNTKVPSFITINAEHIISFNSKKK